jgi:FtsP/CotA-like multicopper oxidase with cupredoxin domain
VFDSSLSVSTTSQPLLQQSSSPAASTGHKFTLIAVDGNYIVPMQADCVDCGNGERYDVLLEADAPTADGGLYWATAQSRY